MHRRSSAEVSALRLPVANVPACHSFPPQSRRGKVGRRWNQVAVLDDPPITQFTVQYDADGVRAGHYNSFRK